jgi:hypothetical protein
MKSDSENVVNVMKFLYNKQLVLEILVSKKNLCLETFNFLKLFTVVVLFCKSLFTKHVKHKKIMQSTNFQSKQIQVQHRVLRVELEGWRDLSRAKQQHQCRRVHQSGQSQYKQVVNH